MQHVQKLPLILVQPLDLYVKQALRVEIDAVCAAYIRCQPLLVFQLDRAQLREHFLVIVEAQKLFQLPCVLRKAVADQFCEIVGQRRVCLTQPSAVGDAVRDVDEPALIELGIVSENTVFQNLRVQL